MITLIPFGAGTKKTSGDKFVNSKTMTDSISKQVYKQISLMIRVRAQDSPGLTHASTAPVATYSAKIGNTIKPLIANYISPFFAFKFFWGKLGISHRHSPYQNVAWSGPLKRATVSAVRSIIAYFAIGSLFLCTAGQTPDRKLLEAANEEIKYLTAKVAALEKVDRGNRELVDSLQALVDGQAKALATCKAAIAKGDQISNVDDKLLTSLQASLTDAKAQITRLEARVSFWRRAAAMGVMAAVGIGIAIGIAISK